MHSTFQITRKSDKIVGNFEHKWKFPSKDVYLTSHLNEAV